jgi:hypothetical protein
MTPLLARDVAPKNTDTALLVGTPDIAGHTDADVRLLCHDSFLLLLPHLG